MNTRSMLTVVLPAAALALAACSSETEPAATVSAAPAVPASLFLTAAPAEPQELRPAKEAAKAGDEVIVRGRIGGRAQPFVPGRAMFILTDATLPSCADMSEDHCPTPWDYCCEDTDILTASTATIRVLGPDGQPLKADLNGQGGVKPAAEVIVVGKVAERDEAGTMIIDATGLYVRGG